MTPREPDRYLDEYEIMDPIIATALSAKRQETPEASAVYAGPSLLPRVLAVVNADAKHSGDPALIYLAAELRAYIAKANGEGT